MQVFGLYGQFRHVLCPASRVTADEVRNELQVEMLLLAYPVKDLLELDEKSERRFAHQFQHVVTGMFRCHLQSSAHMMDDELARIFT